MIRSLRHHRSPAIRVAAIFFLLLPGIAMAVWSAVAQQGQVRTRSPHVALSLPCESCHTTMSWVPIRSFPDFKHGSTRYPLQGMHTGVDCMQCHNSLVFANVGSNCSDCHADIHRRQMGSNCKQCHTVQGWREIARGVATHENRFPLFGAHARALCEDCHTNAAVGLFRGLSTECASCHMEDYRSAKSIDHQAAGYSTQCQTCHGSDSWQEGFDHSLTGFPLVGAHSGLDCAQCHIGGNFTATPADCVGCHLQDYNGTTDPNHVTSGFSQNFASCHGTITWAPATFNHSATRFPLTGAHVPLQCTDCHVGGQYTGLPTACDSCHLEEYNATTSPNHKTAGFPQDCSACHSTAAWSPAAFDHSKTEFPLTGAHVPLQCPACHGSGQYAGLPSTCVSCHLARYNATTNPNHASAGFPQECAVCHSTTAWTPAAFNHSTTQFPLTGAHTSVQCTNCHINGVYDGTPTDCYSCHSGEYNSTTDPNHAAAGFSRDCSQCHSTSSWSGASFTHSWFPIYSGSHAGKWGSCSECHLNANDYSAFSCTNCHEHEKTEMDSKHNDVSNYVYNSANCYSCHPTGQSD